MKRWKNWAGIILSLTLAAACIPEMSAHAGNYVTAEKSLLFGAVAGMPAGNSAGEQTSKEASGQEGTESIFEIFVGNGQSIPQYQAGQNIEKRTVRVVNTGDSDLQNVKIVPVIEDTADWPFEMDGIRHGYFLDEIKAEKYAEATWKNLHVREDVETKTFKLVFHISYEEGKEKSECDRYIEVKTAEKDPGDSQCPDNGISAQPGEGQQPDPGLDAGGVFNGDMSAVGGGGSDEKKGVPRVIVTGFNTEPGAVNAGSNFRLIVHVKNTSTTTAVSNMLFDFQAPSAGTEAAAEAPAFLPSSGASSIYLDQIPAGETRDVAIDLNARADLVQKPYSINMSMLYEDSNASQYEGSSSLAIPIYQAARFEFSEIELSPPSIEVGQEANLMCSLYNTGRVKLYNVKAKFMGDGISAKEVFVGNLDSGATGNIDGMLTGESEIMPGTKCKMIVTYEDESGNPSSREEEFELQVTAPMEMDMGDMEMMGEMPEEAKGFPVIPAVIAAAVVLVIVLAVVLTRRRKKKRAQAEEEDLANEVDRFTEDE